MNNLNLIIGEDSELVNFYLYDIVKKIDIPLEEKIEYDLSLNKLSDVIDEASMISLFSSKKMIIANNLDVSKISNEEMEYLNKYLDNINKDVYIILVASKVDGRSKSYKLFKDNFNIIDISKSSNDDNIFDYVKNKIKKQGYKISDEDINYLISKTGNNIFNIDLELEKIFNYKQEDKNIDKVVIDLLIMDNIDSIIYEFTNAVFERNYNKIIKMYNDFNTMNVGYDYLLVSLANSFRQALIIKLLYNKGESNQSIATFIGKKEFYVKKMLERLYEYTIDDLSEIILDLSKIDREYKSGKTTLDMLEMFLLKFKN